MIYKNHYDSPLGGITLASDGEGLTGLWFDGQKYFAHGIRGLETEDIRKTDDTKDIKELKDKTLPVLKETARWLDIYFSGRDPGFTPELMINTTPFRKAVWEILLTIPYGRTMTYGQIAGILAERKGLKTMSAQAVGGAVGHNDISLIIPCHRVVGADGSMTGYAGGTDKKVWLLKHEGYEFK